MTLKKMAQEMASKAVTMEELGHLFGHLLFLCFFSSAAGICNLDSHAYAAHVDAQPLLHKVYDHRGSSLAIFYLRKREREL